MFLVVLPKHDDEKIALIFSNKKDECGVRQGNARYTMNEVTYCCTAIKEYPAIRSDVVLKLAEPYVADDRLIAFNSDDVIFEKFINVRNDKTLSLPLIEMFAATGKLTKARKLEMIESGALRTVYDLILRGNKVDDITMNYLALSEKQQYELLAQTIGGSHGSWEIKFGNRYESFTNVYETANMSIDLYVESTWLKLFESIKAYRKKNGIDSSSSDRK